jgi:hypothetical protein
MAERGGFSLRLGRDVRTSVRRGIPTAVVITDPAGKELHRWDEGGAS